MAFLVKICGIRRVEDWEACVESGADLVGLVFYPPSKRHLGVDGARALGRATGWLPPGPARPCTFADLAAPRHGSPLRVGVFVNPTADDVEAAAEAAGLAAIQIHGGAPLEGALRARELGLPLLLGLPVGASLSEQQFEVTREMEPLLYLADTHRPGQHGGTGEQFAHNLLRPYLPRYPVLLAGGLDPDIVRAAVAALPGLAGCDVSSGVEGAPGVKDTDRIRRFVAEARQGSAEALASQ